MAGSHGPRSIPEFMTDNYGILNHLVGLPFGVPSHDTIMRVLSNVDPQQVADICRKWAEIEF
ncbi:MAG: transposase family protein [Desulfovibrio sp.]|nr:transposase family protein [Desulfovibrio sp.]